MGGGMELGIKKINIMEKVKEILEEKDEEKKRSKHFFLNLDFESYFRQPYMLDELIDTIFNGVLKKYSEMKVNLMLYCILVNGLDKTKGEKFNQIKKEIQPLIKILKEIFCEFDKNEIHKERTFIFALRSPAGYEDDLYIINNKDNILSYSSNYDVKSMFLNRSTNRDEKDKRNFEYYDIALDYYLQG